MSNCRRIDEYLNRSLKGAALSAFEEHLAGCDHCQAELQSWEEAENGLHAWASFKQGPTPTQEGAADLIASAYQAGKKTPMRPGGQRAIGLSVVAAVAAAALVFVIWQPFGPEPPRQTSRPENIARTEVPKTAPSGVLIEATEHHEFQIFGLDRIAVVKDGRARVNELENNETIVTLGLGTAVFGVAPISETHRFIVRAREVDVHVKGTAFSVTLDADAYVTVVVAEGLVEVRAEDKKFPVAADQKWSNRPKINESDVTSAPGADLKLIETILSYGEQQKEPKSATPKPRRKHKRSVHKGLPDAAGAPAQPDVPEAPVVDYDRWRRQIVSGQHRGAADAIAAHLESATKDHKAWSLLADAERKDKNWRGAVKAYNRVIELSQGSTANRARYMAADIYQKRLGDHGAATKLLEEYLASAPASESQYNIAKVQLARSLAKQGHKQKAITHLEEVLAGNPSSFVASNATALLEELKAAR